MNARELKKLEQKCAEFTQKRDARLLKSLQEKLDKAHKIAESFPPSKIRKSTCSRKQNPEVCQQLCKCNCVYGLALLIKSGYSISISEKIKYIITKGDLCMNHLNLGETIAYDEAMIQYQLIPQDFSRFVGQLVLMDDDAVGAEEPSWLEVVQLEDYHYNGDVSVTTSEGKQRISKHKLIKNSGCYVAFYAIKPEILNPPEPVPETAVVVSEEYTKAVTLTRHIIANAQAMQQSLYEVCKGLKEMRDGKLYKELGYQNFEDYCKNEIGLTRQQGYTYLKIAENLPEDFVKSTLQIGVQKLALLAKLDEADREELTQRVNPQETSVKELQAEIKRLKAERAEMIEHHVAEQGDFLRKIDQLNETKRQLLAEKGEISLSVGLAENQRDEALQKLETAKKKLDELQKKPEKETVYEDSPELLERIQELESENSGLKEQLAVQETEKVSDGEFDAYFRMFDDALKHMTTYLFRKNCTDFSRKQSISMMETKFERYISALKEK